MDAHPKEPSANISFILEHWNQALFSEQPHIKIQKRKPSNNNRNTTSTNSGDDSREIRIFNWHDRPSSSSSSSVSLTERFFCKLLPEATSLCNYLERQRRRSTSDGSGGSGEISLNLGSQKTSIDACRIIQEAYSRGWITSLRQIRQQIQYSAIDNRVQWQQYNKFQTWWYQNSNHENSTKQYNDDDDDDGTSKTLSIQNSILSSKQPKNLTNLIAPPSSLLSSYDFLHSHGILERMGWDCLTKTQLDSFLQDTMKMEQDVMGLDFFDSDQGKASLLQEFDKYVNTFRFCSINVPKLLEHDENRWKSFFQNDLIHWTDPVET